MTSTLQRAALPDLLSLIDHAHDEGVRVWWRRIAGRDAAWSARHCGIWVDPALTEREARSLLAHELGHAYYGDVGPQPDEVELRAWRYAALLLIDWEEYAEAEWLYGPHLGGLAEALGVTREVVQAFQAVIERAA